MTAHTPSTDTLMSDTIKILLVDDDRNEEVILRRIASKVTTHTIELHYSETIAEALAFIRESNDIRLVLMDNRLMPTVDFRESVPALRQAGFIGPVGVISSSLDDPYFQAFEDYGVDFRIDKSELDPAAVEFLVREYVIRD
ncbi:hypothetical protein [Rhizobium sp. SG2393]|uniref:hypothetical protein n=1 Tax=Rhizobium sp. SG2393 TaxID=3276279 RepID=UPI00366FC6E1